MLSVPLREEAEGEKREYAMKTNEPFREQFSAEQSRRNSGQLLSCLFASLSVLLYIGVCISANYMNDLLGSVSLQEKRIYTSPEQIPTFHWLEYTRAISLGEGFWIAGGVFMLLAIISGHLSVFQGRRARDWHATWLGTIGLVVGYLCILVGLVSGLWWFSVYWSTIGWGLSM